MSLTNILDIAYVRVGIKDINASQIFLERFGFSVQRLVNSEGENVLYSSGTNGLPYSHVAVEGEAGFLAVAFEADSRETLELLSEQPDASPIEAINAPGGGEKVSFVDPNGYTVEVVYGWKKEKIKNPFGRLPFNSGGEKNRLGKPVRLQQSKSQVKRLGHCVLVVKNYRKSEAWYKNLFGFLTTDEIYAGVKENVIGAFMRCNRGATPVDHHTLALMQSPDPDATGMQHAAYEVHDWDDLMIGHHVLGDAGYKPFWGVGKHILGSQTFDYWHDPDGHVMEHFTDGDLFDASHPPSLESIDSLYGAQWGPARA